MDLLWHAISGDNAWRGVYLFILACIVLAPVGVLTIVALAWSRIRPKIVYVPLSLVVGLLPSVYVLGTEYGRAEYLWLFVAPGLFLHLVVLLIYLAVRIGYRRLTAKGRRSRL